MKQRAPYKRIDINNLNREQLNQIILNYLLFSIYKETHGLATDLVFKLSLTYDWKSYLKAELDKLINISTDFLLSKEGKTYFRTVILANILKEKSVFLIKEPILMLDKNDSEKILNENFDSIRGYFISVISAFFSDQIIINKGDTFESFQENDTENLKYWVLKNIQQFESFMMVEILDFPGLALLKDVLSNLYFIAFLNHCLVNDSFNFNIQELFLFEQNVLGKKKMLSYNWKVDKQDDLKLIYHRLKYKLVDVSYNNFKKAFSGVFLDDITPLKTKYSFSELIYFIQRLMDLNFITKEKNFSDKRIELNLIHLVLNL